MGEVATIAETPCTTSYSSSNSLEITEEEAKLSCIFNEEVHHIPTPPAGSGEGIHANDIGSLLEQFLEYEQGSEGDASSRQDSYFITPVGSPGGPNDDVVLGRLMIVQEKLTQEVENNTTTSSPSPTPEAESDAQTPTIDNNNTPTVDNNNTPTEKLRVDGLLRTVNGIHPKGSNIRMADSPKFARFKKKKQTEPLRRCNSGPTTPRSVSPRDINNEELKRREAKLIEALALTTPKEVDNTTTSTSSDKTDINKAKRNLNEVGTNKRKQTEPVASRLMPVVSKRQRTMEMNSQLKKVPGLYLDPRLVKNDYCEKSNTTNLMNTNLDQINGAVVDGNEDTTVDNIGIIDMTIDHEALAGTIITPSKNIDTIQSPTATTPKESTETTINNVEIVEEKNSMIEQLEQLDKQAFVQLEEEPLLVVDQLELLPVDKIKQEPVDEDEHHSTSEIVQQQQLLQQQQQNVHSPVKKSSLPPTVDNMKNNETSFKSKQPRTIQLVKPHCMKPPKNYRQTNNMNEPSSSSDSDSDYDRGVKRTRRKTPIKRRRQRSRSRSRTRSRSPISRRSRSRSRSRSPGSPIPRSQLYDTNRSSDARKSKHNSGNNSDEENIDISNKLSELSNPVPYDIEHERKLQFLVGKNHGGYKERRNIYVGGIDKSTTKQDLIERFRRFGKIEKTTLHFRDRGDNYAFIVYEHPDCAMRAIEEGNDDPTFPRLELCFGGRRKFVGGSYVDFDGNNSYLEETERNSRNLRCDSPEDDFDSLLKRATKDIRRRDVTPEWD